MPVGPRFCRFGVLVMALGVLWLMTNAAAAADADGNSLETRTIKVVNARLPGNQSLRQTIIAWQVTQGSWSGQTLDGLCIVLVKTTSEDGRQATTTTCYVSHDGTLAQRQAILTAFLATHPDVSPENITRLEPAVITVEIEGSTLVLHLGLVA